MDIKAQSLYNELQSLATQAGSNLSDLQPAQINPSSQNFADMLGQAIKGVNDSQLHAKDMVEKFEFGVEGVSLVDVQLAREKSGIGFEATLQVRNKVLEAYRQIMNMQV